MWGHFFDEVPDLTFKNKESYLNSSKETRQKDCGIIGDMTFMGLHQKFQQERWVTIWDWYFTKLQLIALAKLFWRGFWSSTENP